MGHSFSILHLTAAYFFLMVIYAAVSMPMKDAFEDGSKLAVIVLFAISGVAGLILANLALDHGFRVREAHLAAMDAWGDIRRLWRFLGYVRQLVG